MTSIWKEKQALQGYEFEEKEEILEEAQEVLEELSECADEEGFIEITEEDAETLENLQEELNTFSAEMNAKFNELYQDGYDINKMKEGVSELITANSDNKENKAAVDQLQKFLVEMEEVATFEPFKKSVKKIKNKEHIKNTYLENFDNSLMKFTKKIKENRTYTFIKPDSINIVNHATVLLNAKNQDDVKLFLYLFFGFGSQQKNLTKHALMINEILRQIKHVATIKPEEKESFIKNANSILEDFYEIEA
jgi:hypothetical protein